MRYLTAGESHGKTLVGIIEGLPAGLAIDMNIIDEMLRLRQNAPFRGTRQKLNIDKAKILSGIDGDVTTGAPIAVTIDNGENIAVNGFDFYRPGHVDYAAAKKYGYEDIYVGAERASARETAVRTALGAIAKQLLSALNITIEASLVSVGGVDIRETEKLEKLVSDAQSSGDTLGGKVSVILRGVKAGIGSHVFFDRRLDYKLGGAFMSIPAVKAVELGEGERLSRLKGSEAADGYKSENGKIIIDPAFSGGIDGGISNGGDIKFTLSFKPVPSVAGVDTVNKVGQKTLTKKVRSDICAAPAALPVVEAVAALELCSAILDCIGGDTMDEVKTRYAAKGSDL